MKTRIFAVLTVGCLLSVAGCAPATPSGSGGTIPVEPRPVEPAPHAGARARNGNVDVEVGRPGEKPAVGVDVRPGGDVNVEVDRNKIRERIDERRR